MGEVQRERQSNVVPLGEVGSGVFQHRALLFKVRDHHSLSLKIPPLNIGSRTARQLLDQSLLYGT